MKALVLGTLPSAAVVVDVARSVQALENLSETKLFQFVSVGLQSNVMSIVEWLKTMRDGRAPKLPNTTGNEFFTKVIEKMGFFARVADGTGPGVVGRAALESMLAAAKQKSDIGKIGLPDLRPFGQFNWLLTKSELAEVQVLTEAVMLVTTTSKGALPKAGSVHHGGSAASGSSGSSKTVPAKKTMGAAHLKRRSDEDILRAATKAMFRN